MVKALFVHDHRFLLKEGIAYSPGKLPASTWARYLSCCDELVVVGRSAHGDDDSGRWVRSSAEQVQMRLLSPRRRCFLSERGGTVGWRQFWAELRAVDFAIVRHPSFLGAISFLLMRLLNKPVLVECVGLAKPGFAAQGGVRGKLLGWLLDKAVKRQVRQAKGVIYVTEHYLQGVYPTQRPSSAISNVALPVESLRQGPRSIAAGRAPILGFVGDVNSRLKGFATLLEVAVLLRQAGLVCAVECVGSRPTAATEELVARYGLEEQIRFCGVKPPGADMWQWYDRIDLFLSLSYSEGLPRTVIEAMARGCAVIGTDVGGTTELLPEDRLVAPGDSQAVARAALAILNQAAPYEKESLRNIVKARDYCEEQLREKRRIFISSVLRSV
jgi:glycosyltransferase involved in cell wall biosynthesis